VLALICPLPMSMTKTVSYSQAWNWRFWSKNFIRQWGICYTNWNWSKQIYYEISDKQKISSLLTALFSDLNKDMISEIKFKIIFKNQVATIAQRYKKCFKNQFLTISRIRIRAGRKQFSIYFPFEEYRFSW
jgi:hypothetical protein